jgi:iron complex transport system ATP-binding protein
VNDARPPDEVAGDTPVVDLRGVEVRIDGRRIVGPLDWTIRPGERWVLLGPNGCGKTTLLRVLSLMLHPSAGTVSVLGLTLGRTDLRPHRHRIGVVSAAVANSLRPALVTRDVVMTALHGALEPWWHEYTADDDRRARAALDRLGLGGFADHEFGTLSSGERQRALIARALVTDPELLVLDEPASGLDLVGRETLLADLHTLASDPTTPPTVLVTHHVEEIPEGTTHVMLMRAGRAVAAGPIGTTLTADALSETFGVPVTLERSGGRWWARARSAGSIRG